MCLKKSQKSVKPETAKEKRENVPGMSGGLYSYKEVLDPIIKNSEAVLGQVCGSSGEQEATPNHQMVLSPPGEWHI